jgi:hypothetical protein
MEQLLVEAEPKFSELLVLAAFLEPGYEYRGVLETFEGVLSEKADQITNFIYIHQYISRPQLLSISTNQEHKYQPSEVLEKVQKQEEEQSSD